MFHSLWSRQITALGHMGDDQYGDVSGLAYLHQLVAAGPDLGHAARRRIQFVTVHCLDRIYYQKVGFYVIAYCLYIFHVGLRQHEKIVGKASAHSVCPEFYLFVGFFTGHIEDLIPAARYI